MLGNKALITAKTEGTYGVDSNPTAASNAILCSSPQIEVVGKKVDRSAVMGVYGKLAPINAGEGIKISFSVELRGAGATPNTPPRIGALLRACNFTETIDATPGAEHTQYDPNSAENGESVTIYFYKDGIHHKALGCVGTFKIEAKVNELVTLQFEFHGLYSSAHASDSAFPAGTWGDAAIPPLFRQAAFSILGYSANVEKLSIDVGNEIKPRRSVNGTASGVSRYFIANRGVKGDCDPEAVALAEFNPWALWDASTAGSLSATVGNTAGNRCVISMPNIMPDVPKYGEREGYVTYGCGFSAHPALAGGNNELSLKFN